jgi:hypothetical protein
MKKKPNFVRFALLVLVIALLTMGSSQCGGPEVPANPNLGTLNNDLKDGGYVTTKTIDGITFKDAYSTDYDVSNWMVTSTKTIKAKIAVTDAPIGTRIQIVHIHVDTSLVSRNYEINGLKIDSMDDELGSGLEAGVDVSETYPYELIFSVEGFSKDLIDGWVFVTGSYGSGEVTQTRLTEENLIGVGKVYGQKFSYVYKVLVMKPGEKVWHEVTWVDEFLVPVKGGVSATSTPSSK